MDRPPQGRVINIQNVKSFLYHFYKKHLIYRKMGRPDMVSPFVFMGVYEREKKYKADTGI